MNKLDPTIEAELEAKYIAVNKADMKLHLARVELRNAVVNAICSMLPKDSDKDEIVRVTKAIKAFNALDLKERKVVIDLVWNALN